MYTKEQLLSQLNTFKSAVGKPVLVHSSLRSVGPVEGGGEAILDVLKEFSSPKITAFSASLPTPGHGIPWICGKQNPASEPCPGWLLQETMAFAA